MVFAQEEWEKYWYWRRQASPSVWLVPSHTLPSAVPGHLMNYIIQAESNEYHRVSRTNMYNLDCKISLTYETLWIPAQNIVMLLKGIQWVLISS